MKYATLAELLGAYRAGVAETIFKMDSCDLLRQALDLLQIPNEHG